MFLCVLVSLGVVTEVSGGEESGRWYEGLIALEVSKCSGSEIWMSEFGLIFLEIFRPIETISIPIFVGFNLHIEHEY